MTSDPSWGLYRDDLFDRKTPATLEKHGRGLVAGLELLWQRTLEQGIVADGRRSFAHFSLRFDDQAFAPVAIPLSPTHVNETIVRMRGWVEEHPKSLGSIAMHHAAWIVADPEHGTRRMLDCAEHAAVPEDLACNW